MLYISKPVKSLCSGGPLNAAAEQHIPGPERRAAAAAARRGARGRLRRARARATPVHRRLWPLTRAQRPARGCRPLLRLRRRRRRRSAVRRGRSCSRR